MLRNVRASKVGAHRSNKAPSDGSVRAVPGPVVLWWFGLLLLHGANVAYYVGFAMLYKMFDNTYLDFQLSTYKIGLRNTEYPTIIAVHACIAALHVVCLGLMVVGSIHARRFAFQPDRQTVCWLMDRIPCVVSGLRRARVNSSPQETSVRSSGTSRSSSALALSQRVSSSLGSARALVFARDGLLGVDSVYFDHILIVREIVETALQTYQLYRMTLVLPRLWLIRFYVVLLVGNCWAVPFLHRYYRDRETTRRMLCLLCDAVLDMVSSIGVSVVIFATYAPQYVDPQGFGFSFITWFNDEWIASMQQEFQMMLVASWGDLVSRLVFALGLLQCMDALKDILTETQGPKLGPPAAQALTHRGVAPSMAEIRGAVSSDDGGSVTNNHGHASETTPTSRATSAAMHLVDSNANRSHCARAPSWLVHVAVPALFVAWGLLILVVHLVAESHHATTACSLPLQPWLSGKPGCALVDINCEVLASTGHDAAFENAWDAFDPDRVARVVIRHCPELHVLSKIRQLHTMSGFKVYNSTIVAWDDDAAITEMDHASMRMVVLLRTTLPNGALPMGLLSAQFPRRFVAFYSSCTNLKSLPADLDVKWPSGMQLVLETSLLTTIPDVVVRLQPRVLSFSGSPVLEIPSNVMELPHLTVLQIGRTKVQALPQNVERMNPRFTVLMLHHTNVTLFPSYLNGYVRLLSQLPRRMLHAFGSPYCRELDEIVAGTRLTFSAASHPDAGVLMDVSTSAKLAFVRRVVDCTDADNVFYYPLLVDLVH